ncbi:hypothetical protein HanRHA438_Chr13g0593021 [Helianthus annuus]|nr:hypothetical protein HanRHA438_Chr13g0593021 [Helianthus annuus]
MMTPLQQELYKTLSEISKQKLKKKTRVSWKEMIWERGSSSRERKRNINLILLIDLRILLHEFSIENTKQLIKYRKPKLF